MQTPSDIRPVPTLDEYGLLRNPDTWDESVAWGIAAQLGIHALTDSHWKVIYALREHYAEFGVAPPMKNICRAEGKPWSWVHELFDSCLNAWRVAGLPNPGEEAKSYLSDM
ncbi:TusE/DsrC/DsvC family sulfur relay protein [Sulfuriflexus mobilis]|uniref:TusE/DsrC/DsvC family sulfur relay protein n=1 Tax=Sulfuriflexus mobilis TaxID=1811807 RepID=UPI000F8309D8|nr:TusE/DsrC/DsvC family sulfur relay protein [Sulfuriflexus mobilis]